MLAAVLSYNLESIAADQSEDNHRESIIIQVSNSDLFSLTSDFVRHSGVQNLCLLPLKNTRTTVDTITKQVKAYKKRNRTFLLQGMQHPERHRKEHRSERGQQVQACSSTMPLQCVLRACTAL